MLETKRDYGKEDGVQYYHMIQSFRPGEITPELALEIAKEFASEHLPGYQTVIGVHVDKEHIHAHILFNSVNADTGGKYHSNAQSYYRQIRAISDRLCEEHGLSVIVRGESSKAVSYIEWLRQSRGQATFRSMLEADLREAIQDANDLGHFFLLMEHKGYEIRHGNRLGFRLRGQDRFMIPGRKNPLFTEDGIRAAIQGNLSAIEAGRRPAILPRTAYQPYTSHPKYKGFLALYVHYLYLLGKIGQRQYPPRMTPQLRQEVMKAERYRAQFAFLRENNITGPDDMTAFLARTEETLASLTKRRTILNVRKNRRKRLYTALADAEALAPARELYEEGVSGMEAEFAQYAELLRQPEAEARDVALAIELFTEGSLNTFAKPTNVDTSSRILCYDIRDLGKQLQPVGMLVMLDSVFNRIIRNRKLGKNTWVYIDEIYLLFQHEYSANFLFTLWKRVRKYGACCTGLTQNVDDLLQSHTARTMLANSEFLVMLNQAATDRAELANLLNISDNQLSYITNVDSGRGLIKCGSAIVPFMNSFPKNRLYQLMTTRPSETMAAA